MKLFAALFAASLLTGCVQTTVMLPDGSKFTRSAFLNRTQVGDVEIQIGTNAVLRIRGYANDQVQAAEAIARGVAQGVAGSIK